MKLKTLVKDVNTSGHYFFHVTYQLALNKTGTLFCRIIFLECLLKTYQHT